MKKHLMAASAATLVAGVPASAQQPAKPIGRADYVKQVDAHFGSMDTNHDGVVTKAELTAELQREVQLAQARIQAQLTERFKQLDTNKDGKLSLQEFMAIAGPIRPTETPDQMLARLDTNHDGKISTEEFRVPELAKFTKVDTNHDGVVTPDEIKAAAGRK